MAEVAQEGVPKSVRSHFFQALVSQGFRSLLFNKMRSQVLVFSPVGSINRSNGNSPHQSRKIPDGLDSTVVVVTKAGEICRG